MNFIKEILSAKNGTLSSKRLVALISILLVSIAFISNLFWGYKIDQFIFNDVMYIVIGSLGITGVEKFAPKQINEE